MNDLPRRSIPVVAAVIFHEKRVLAAKRKAGGPSGGFWEFAGGKIEPGESPEQALIREIREELGLEIKVGSELGKYVTALEPYTIHLQCFWCDWVGGQVQLNDHDEVRWCSVAGLQALEWSLPDIPAVGDVLRALANDA